MSWFQTLLATIGLGQKAPSIAPRFVDQVIQPLPLSLQIQRIGGGLTPQDVSLILREADTGRCQRLVDLGNETRQKDCHVQSVLGTREMALAGLEWTVAPPQTGTRKKDKKASEFVIDALRGSQNFDELVSDLVGADFYGHSADEAIYRKDGSYVVPDRFSHVSQRRFEFRDLDGVLVWRDEGMTKGLDLLRDFPAGKFIQHQPRITGDVPCREGLIRVLVWAALFRNWTIRDWVQLAEIGWKPYRLAIYKKGASSEDIAALTNAINVLTATGAALLPETTEFNVEWPKATGTANSGTHAELANFLGAEISKAVLGQTLTTEQGQRGSQALGQVHDNVRRDILEFDARSIAATIQRHLVAPLVKRNFGDSVEVPEFAFITQDTVNLKEFAEAAEKLAPLMPIPVSWARDQAGIPEPVDDEDTLGADIDIPIDPETGLPQEPKDPDGDPEEDDAKEPEKGA